MTLAAAYSFTVVVYQVNISIYQHMICQFFHLDSREVTGFFQKFGGAGLSIARSLRFLNVRKFFKTKAERSGCSLSRLFRTSGDEWRQPAPLRRFLRVLLRTHLGVRVQEWLLVAE